MQTIRLDGTDLIASRIGLGTWAIGGFMWGGTDEKSAVATIHRALEQGINLVDTAPAYGFGKSELLVGRALSTGGRRAHTLIATKVGLEWTSSHDLRRNASRERIFTEIDDSLKRLKTDHVDLYQVHWPDPFVPVEETAEAMATLLEAGKIRAIGVSNFSPAQMDAFRRVAPIHVAQPPLNLFEREAEVDVLPYCREYRIATLTYGVLCRGLLSGRMGRETSFTGDDLRKDDPKFLAPRYPHYLEAARRLEALAQRRFGRGLLDLAVRWVLDQPGVSVALWGARRPEQLDAVPRIAGDWCLDPEVRAEVDRILEETIPDPVGPEFMAPPSRELAVAPPPVHRV
jgi:aryl-alcohol dehydrogenase-like predicted oxidoreductase